MTDKRHLDDTELDGLFTAARHRTPAPSPDLIARIIAQAEAVAAPAVPTPTRPGVIARLLDAIGGWPAAAGLATATVAGLAIGLGSPDTLDTLSGGYLATAGNSYQLEDLLPSFGDLMEEG